MSSLSPHLIKEKKFKKNYWKMFKIFLIINLIIIFSITSSYIFLKNMEIHTLIFLVVIIILNMFMTPVFSLIFRMYKEDKELKLSSLKN